MDEQILQNGALLDTRTEAEKAKDFKFEEIVASVAPVIWKEKNPTSWRKFPIFNQDGSGSCVAQTMAKILGVMYWLKNNVYVHFSATHIYQRRFNKPQGGMAGVDAFKISQEGATLEVLTPSQDMTDIQMDTMKIEKYKEDVGKIFKLGNYIMGPVADMETVASIIQTTGKAVMVWYYFKGDEWTDVPAIKHSNLDLSASSTLRHSVTAVDFTLYKGKKCLIIEDSWGPNHGKGGQRIITEDFHNARNWFTAHPMNFNYEDPQEPTMPKPRYSGSIVSLQDCLKHYGTFPLNVESTGIFGSITKKAVMEFQVREGLHSTGVPNVGPLTTARLNLLYP